MKILVCHNFYQQRGGEDRVYEAETRLLEAHGHDVVRYEARNDVIGPSAGLAVAASTIWNPFSYRAIRRVIRAERPSLMHVHNTLPLLSPSVYYAAHAEGVPVVQTLHNYRLTCANAQLFRNDHVCEECVGLTAPWPAVAHACYRGSRGASATVAAMLMAHRAIGTWTRVVDAYVAVSEFERRKLIEGGLPSGRLYVKGNFVSPDPGVGDGSRRGVVFVGRLSPEKGVRTMLDAWKQVGNIPLTIVGDGPLAPAVRGASRANANITWVGYRPAAEVSDIIARAACLICTSEWHEPFGLVIAEAFARGTPVIATRVGALPEMVEHNQTGLLFEPGDARALAESVRALFADRPRLESMRAAARRAFERRLTADANYHSLMRIYAAAFARANRSASVGGALAVKPDPGVTRESIGMPV